MQLFIFKDEQQYGPYDPEQISSMVASGSITTDDLAWYEGLESWQPLNTIFSFPAIEAAVDIVPPPPSLSANSNEVKSPRGSGGAKPKKEKKPKHDWRLDPASEKQINYLASFGQSSRPELTKGEASDLLDKLSNDPAALKRQEALRQSKFEEERKNRAAFPSYFLKADIVSATGELEGLKSERDKAKLEMAGKVAELSAVQKKLELTNDEGERVSLQEEIENIQEEIESSKSDLTDYPDNLKDAQDDLKFRVSSRVKFWKATFKEDWVLGDEEADLIDFSDTIDRLYSEYGRYFKVPTNKQITEILEALDTALPDWDKNQPHSFYSTLKASFPEGVRKSVKEAPVAQGKGCLVLMAGLILVPYLISCLRS